MSSDDQIDALMYGMRLAYPLGAGLMVTVVPTWATKQVNVLRPIRFGTLPRGTDWRTTSRRRKWVTTSTITVPCEPDHVIKIGNKLLCTVRQYAVIQASGALSVPIKSGGGR